MYLLRLVLSLAFFTFGKTEDVFQDYETGEVVFVNVLHRHGDRAPTYFYPTDPYLNQSYWPEGIGQLTSVGKKQAFELGRWLRKRYDSLLTDTYSPDVIYVRSTDKDRTLMSAECNLAGMFPPKGVQVWSDDLAWQPIPVHTTALKLDKVLGQPPRTPCPAYDQELQRVFTSDDKIRKLNQTYSEMFRRINEKSGTKVNFTLLTVYLMYDPLFVENLYNFTLPEWTESVFPTPMQEANLYNYMLPIWTPKLIRLTTGLLLQEMIQNMLNKVQNQTTRNLHVYSAHDETIVNLLTALGAFNNILPPYVSCLMMELRVNSSGNYYVSLYYRNSTTDVPYLLTVGGCVPLCPLDTFITITRHLIPDDWDQECRVADDQNSYLKIVLLAVTFVTVLAVVIWIIYYCYPRRE